jgi:nucleotide-binding universal stress UspA family protein
MTAEFLEEGAMETYRMIVGVDGSEAGQRALNWAIGEAARRQRAGQACMVEAITAWEVDPIEQPPRAIVGLPDAGVSAQEVLDQAVARAREDHPEVTVAKEVVQAIPYEALVRAGDNADLLVLGSHGHNHGHLAVVGSVTEGCIRNATCPVLVLPLAYGAVSTTR